MASAESRTSLISPETACRIRRETEAELVELAERIHLKAKELDKLFGQKLRLELRLRLLASNQRHP